MSSTNQSFWKRRARSCDWLPQSACLGGCQIYESGSFWDRHYQENSGVEYHYNGLLCASVISKPRDIISCFLSDISHVLYQWPLRGHFTLCQHAIYFSGHDTIHWRALSVQWHGNREMTSVSGHPQGILTLQLSSASNSGYEAFYTIKSRKTVTASFIINLFISMIKLNKFRYTVNNYD